MSEQSLDRWTAIGSIVICASVAAPMLVWGFAAGTQPTVGPVWLWWTVYGTFVLALAALMLPGPGQRPRGRNLAVGVLVTSAVLAVLLLDSGQGWTPILMVFSAAMAASTWSRPAAIAVVVVQSLALLAGATLVADVHGIEVAIYVGFYGVMQAFVVVAQWLEARQSATRAELAATNVELQATQALLEESVRGAERVRIARDLHDAVGHQLTALSLELEVASHRAQPPASEHVTRARRLATDLLTEVRDTVGQLRSQPVELEAALAALCTDVQRPRIHLQVDEAIEVDEARLSALMRAAQEIVTNAIRHSEAENVWLRVSRHEDAIVLIGEDDGGGGADDISFGHGLTGLTERVHELGGRVSVEPGKGFRVTAQVPLPDPTVSATEVPAP
ncbi:sensor histidine kinase [Egibacter rhizosphaerae]|nr:sensor histidine kinase [Egibacter rhizosphaerae]